MFAHLGVFYFIGSHDTVGKSLHDGSLTPHLTNKRLFDRVTNLKFPLESNETDKATNYKT